MSPHLGSISVKVFLLGEYAVLAGLPAIGIAVGPRFELLRDSSAQRVTEFHPQSPAAILISRAQKQINSSSALSKLIPELSFKDPFNGSGGFGASTAQFALCYCAIATELGNKLDWQSVWTAYRESSQAKLKPSGADLVTQWHGGVTLFSPSSIKAEDLSHKIDFSNLLIFSATTQPGRKVATHDHLDSLKSISKLEVALRAPLEKGLQAIRDGNPENLGAAMDSYAQALELLGLEIEATREDRHILRRLPGVCGVKGAGAMQADAVLVWVKDNEAKGPVRALAESRGLHYVGDGNQKQSGIQWQT